jgi:hypothetical protein
MQHNLAFVFAFAFGFGFANVREIDEQNSEPFITVNRLLKTWVSGMFQSNSISWTVLLPNLKVYLAWPFKYHVQGRITRTNPPAESGSLQD